MTNSVIKGDAIYENHTEDGSGKYIKARLSRNVKTLKKLTAALSRLKGQAHVGEAVKETLFGIMQKQNKKGVLASFLFIGPPAAGKTLTAEIIAEALDDIPYKILDMSSYGTKDSSLDFCGLHPSFKSSKPGDATDFVNKNPLCVLVLDEIEKAHPSILNLLFQIMDRGEIEDMMLKKNVDFRNVILVITSNLGSSIYNSSISHYNFSSIPQATIVNALNTEKNPSTSTPYFPSALVSRFASGRIILFNRLRPECIHKIVLDAIEDEISVYKKEYHIEFDIDANELARSFIFSLGENADIRALKQSVKKFFEANFLGAVKCAMESGGEEYFNKITFRFDKSKSSAEARSLFFSRNKIRLAVLCDMENRDVFLRNVTDDIELFFIDKDFRMVDLSRMDASAVIIDIDTCGGSVAKEVFHEAAQQDRVPIYVYSQKYTSATPFLYYNDRGATDFFYRGMDDSDIDGWIRKISDGMNLTYISQEMFRSGKVLTYDVLMDYDESDRSISMTITNYGVDSAMNSFDRDKFVASHSIPDVSFDDVVGAREAKSEMKSMANALKNFKQLRREGIRIPRGILLDGKPGTGKTMLAKAFAAESKMPFIEKNGSEFLHQYVGNGAEMVRDMFRTARRYAPAVIFIDEVDVIAGKRDAVSSFRTDDVLNALLSEMDGFGDNTDTPVFVIASTNFSSDKSNTKLDPAFLRRFDRTIHIDLPNMSEREEYIRKSLSKSGRSEVGINCIHSLAKRSVGDSLADLELVIQNAIRQCYSGGKINPLTDALLNESYESFFNGAAHTKKKDSIMRTAVHEAGHTVVSYVLGMNPLYATIVGRKSFGGYVTFSSEDEGVFSKADLENKICCFYAGRMAEVMTYGAAGITTGIGQDIKAATKLAESMVAEYGMCGDLVSYVDPKSRRTDQTVRKMVSDLLREQYDRAGALVRQHQNKVNALALALMERNALTEEEIAEVINDVEDD